jgi:hypothetical protein
MPASYYLLERFTASRCPILGEYWSENAALWRAGTAKINVDSALRVTISSNFASDQ